MQDVSRYPLVWPVGWERTPRSQRRRAAFTSGGNPITVAAAVDRLEAEISRIYGTREVLSSNVELNLRGQPRSGQAEPADPGAALYFTLNAKPVAFACDKWIKVADNIAAIANHIDALRRIARYGVGRVEQAFAGYVALPPAYNWRVVLGFGPSDQVTAQAVRDAYRARVAAAHPDKPGGSHERILELNGARDVALAEVAQLAHR